MNASYTYTKTSVDLARDQLSLTRFKSATYGTDLPHVTLSCRDDSSVVIYTYLDASGDEYLSFTSYREGSKTPDDCGGCALQQAPTLLAGLAQYYT
jgi:hypothetical protein